MWAKSVLKVQRAKRAQSWRKTLNKSLVNAFKLPGSEIPLIYSKPQGILPAQKKNWTKLASTFLIASKTSIQLMREGMSFRKWLMVALNIWALIFSVKGFPGIPGSEILLYSKTEIFWAASNWNGWEWKLPHEWLSTAAGLQNTSHTVQHFFHTRLN